MAREHFIVRMSRSGMVVCLCARYICAYAQMHICDHQRTSACECRPGHVQRVLHSNCLPEMVEKFSAVQAMYNDERNFYSV